MKVTFFNGQFIAAAEARVPVLDRSFLYGDGLFETLRIYEGTPFLWDEHWKRLQRGAEFLRINVPFSNEQLNRAARKLIETNEQWEAVLRIHLSRGIGQRGYSIKSVGEPVMVMTIHPAPMLDVQNPLQWRLATSSIRLPANDPLARVKSANKLPQILARAEAEDAGADDALLLNTDGEIAEASGSNFFWIRDGAVGTAPENAGILPGITRATVLQICRQLNFPCAEQKLKKEKLLQCEGAFLTSSTFEIIEVVQLDGQPIPRSPLTGKILAGYRELIRQTLLRQPNG